MEAVLNKICSCLKWHFKQISLKDFAVFAAILLFPILAAMAVSDSIQVSQEVTAVAAVCGNGTCETGETASSCPADCAAAAPAVPSGIGDRIPPNITDIVVKPGYKSAAIYWKTSESALSQFLWGQTSEYEREIISGVIFTAEHSVALVGLAPDTIYHFRILAKDQYGNIGRSRDLTFRTLSALDIIPPANVSKFEAVPGDRQVALSWKNPPDPDFQAVKILRSTFFYPQDPFDGETVYNNSGEFLLDTDVQNGVRYYYTAFAYDNSGNFSSGAIAFAVPGAPPELVPPPEILPPGVEVPPELRDLEFIDLDFWQEGRKLPVENGKLVRVKIGTPLTVSLEYEEVPEVLKTIVMVIERPQENQTQESSEASLAEALARKKIFSFLLRINPEKTRYEATIMPPEDPLLYPFFATVMDFKNQARKRLEGEMLTVLPPLPPEEPIGPKIAKYLLYLLLLLLLILAAIILKRYLKKKRKEKQGQLQSLPPPDLPPPENQFPGIDSS